MGFLERLGTLAIAAALLFAALRIHKSSGKHTRVTKPAGVITAFVAGLAFIVTVVGAWMIGWGLGWASFGVAGLIVCVAIVVVDWLLDGKPDKPALWAAFVLPLFLVIGITSLPAVGNQIGQGGQQVTSQMGKR
jgi:peptidoglycan/LPS O-acetylase OafA/YrhL